MNKKNEGKVEVELYCSEVKKLNQLECWAITAGEGSGSHVTLDFGKKVIREKPLSNRNVSDVSKKYYGEFSIYIEECAWRLESAKEVICGSLSSNDNNGTMVNGLSKLLDKKVINIKVSYPSLDLRISFNGGLKLVLFCNTMSIEDGDNYTFYNPTKIFIVRGSGILNTQERKTAKLELVSSFKHHSSPSSLALNSHSLP